MYLDFRKQSFLLIDLNNATYHDTKVTKINWWLEELSK